MSGCPVLKTRGFDFCFCCSLQSSLLIHLSQQHSCTRSSTLSFASIRAVFVAHSYRISGPQAQVSSSSTLRFRSYAISILYFEPCLTGPVHASTTGCEAICAQDPQTVDYKYACVVPSLSFIFIGSIDSLSSRMVWKGRSWILECHSALTFEHEDHHQCFCRI